MQTNHRDLKGFSSTLVWSRAHNCSIMYTWGRKGVLLPNPFGVVRFVFTFLKFSKNDFSLFLKSHLDQKASVR